MSDGRKSKRRSPAQIAWADSPRFKASRLEGLRKANAQWKAHPKCGAKAKHTGQPCQKPALENGRCRYHGGRSTKGEAWHKPRLPERDAKDAIQKLDAKLSALQRRRAEQEARRAAMTPEARERHEAWRKTHRPGSKAERHHAQQQRETREWLAELMAAAEGTPIDPEKDVFG